MISKEKKIFRKMFKVTEYAALTNYRNNENISQPIFLNQPANKLGN